MPSIDGSAVSHFLAMIIHQRDALFDAVSTDSGALERAGQIWDQRRNPITADRLEEWRARLAQHLIDTGNSPEEAKAHADNAVPFDPETYLQPLDECPPQVTEDDLVDTPSSMG
jgi:hypothetical protein